MIIILSIEKPGKAIYLIKERSKLIRARRDQKKYPIGSIMRNDQKVDEEMKEEGSNNLKRRKINDPHDQKI